MAGKHGQNATLDELTKEAQAVKMMMANQVEMVNKRDAVEQRLVDCGRSSAL